MALYMESLSRMHVERSESCDLCDIFLTASKGKFSPEITCIHEKNGYLTMLQDIFLSCPLMRVADVSFQLGAGATRCDRSRHKFDAKNDVRS